MKKVIILISVVITTLLVGFFVLNNYIYNEKQAVTPTTSDYLNAEFVIDGESMKLGGDLRYFGNDLVVDLNNDGLDDRVFIVTYSPGGSGTFFYVVATLNTEAGYVGSDGYLLGDRIAPQTTELSQNPKYQNVVVVNYVDRALNESMTTPPSIGKSIYLKLDNDTRQWGVVEADFLGEANPPSMTLGMKTWVWQSALYNDGREILPTKNGVFTLTFADDNTFSVTTDCNSAGGNYLISENLLTFSDIFSTEMYCENSQEAEFLKLLMNTNMYHFTSRGELVFDLKFDSGTAIFQ